MVLVVISIVTAVTMPSFIRSMRGNRLRSGARTVVMAGRYARSMAVLNQKEMILELQVDGARVAVRPAAERRLLSGESGLPLPAVGAPGWSEEEVDADPGMDSDEEETGAPRPGGDAEIVRRLDRVRIVEVELDRESEEDETGDGDGGEEEAYRVLYRSNGQCTPYTVTLMDEDGASVVVKVDNLGSVRTDDE